MTPDSEAFRLLFVQPRRCEVHLPPHGRPGWEGFNLAPGVNIAGIVRQPLFTPWWLYGLQPAISTRRSGSRESTLEIVVFAIILAKCDPAQRWMPTPKIMCRLGERSISRRSGSWKKSASRLPDAHGRSTRSLFVILHPWNSTSCIAERALAWTGEKKRRNSSRAPLIFCGCSMISWRMPHVLGKPDEGLSPSMSSDLLSDESSAAIRENIPVDMGSLIARCSR